MKPSAIIHKLILMLCLLTAPTAHAIVVQYSTLDLADTTPGQDRWQYSYTVSDRNFAANEGFSIFFDYTLYGSLDGSPAAVNGDWDILALQPDPMLPDAGLYDALALNNGASLADVFTVAFTWLGSGTPGAQSFAVYDVNFATIESGTTVPAVSVPEPPTALLLLVGLVAFERMRQKRTAGRRRAESNV